MSVEPTGAAGLYVHLPFCHPSDRRLEPNEVVEPPRPDYLDTLQRELDDRFDALTDRRLVSVYFGGGDPSQVPPDWIAALTSQLDRRRDLADVEVTLEGHPVDIDRRRLAAWRDAGVTRLIVGLESLTAETLAALGLPYGPDAGTRALLRCHAFGGFDFGIDLTFGLPGQTLEAFHRDLDRLGELGVPTSVFGFEYRSPDNGDIDDELGADMLESLVDWADRYGLRRYEVASFCRPGDESRHNRLHWEGGEYLGIGLGAASFGIENGVPTRRRNVEDLEAYLAGAAPAEMETVQPEAYLRERVALGLQHRAGLDWNTVVEQLEGAVSDPALRRAEEALEWAVEAGFGEWEGERYRPTDRGLDVADGLGMELQTRMKKDRS